MQREHIRIGTRGSRLALWQAEYLKAQFADKGFEAELKIIKTKGDQVQNLGFDKMEGKGFFTKEIEDALLRGEVDMAVHSMKDLPTVQPEGLVVAGVSYRETPSDCILIRKDRVTEGKIYRLPEGAVVGTSSVRRKAQLQHFRPDVTLKDVRGNVPTRIQKLRDGQFDAIILAQAGITRLQLDTSDLELITPHVREFVPAPAQGVLAYQCCTSDIEMRRIIRMIHHPEVSACTNVERKILKLLDGGCQLPLGAYCERDQLGHYHIHTALAEGFPGPVRHVKMSSSTTYELAEQMVERLKQAI